MMLTVKTLSLNKLATTPILCQEDCQSPCMPMAKKHTQLVRLLAYHGIFNTVNGQFLYLIAANLADQLNASCKKQPGKVYYALATPIETPLTATELTAYKALTAYGPDTVVQAGDGAGVKLGYQRDVNIAIKRIEDAIASMTTT